MAIDQSLEKFFTTDFSETRFFTVKTQTFSAFADDFRDNVRTRKCLSKFDDIMAKKLSTETLFIKPSTQWFGLDGRKPTQHLKTPRKEDNIWVL